MKKLVVAVLAVLFIAPAAMAEGWGIGVKLGAGENDPKDLKNLYDQSTGYNRELDKNAGIFSLEILHEWELNNEADKIGAKIGWDMYGENKVERHLGAYNQEIKEESYAFPFTVYYKRDNGIQKLSWFGGAGVTIMHSKLKATGWVKDDLAKTKVFPHIVIGGEYRFTRVFALGLEARYNFAAKVKKHGDTLSDRSGFGAALTGRFYF